MRPAKSRGEISKDDLSALRRFLTADIHGQTADEWAMVIGEALTSGGAGNGATRVARATVTKRLAAGAMVGPNPAARMGWAALDRGRAAIFINGEARALPREHAFAASFLCGDGSPAAARRLVSTAAMLSLAVDLLRAGVLRWRG